MSVDVVRFERHWWQIMIFLNAVTVACFLLVSLSMLGSLISGVFSF